MPSLYKLARPLLFATPPETAHNLTLTLMKSGKMPRCPPVQNPALEVNLWGLKFPNPVGLAAGFDKNAEVIGAAFDMGFGFVEAGTVTPKAQEGSPKPRVFRDPANNAVINRMGFPGAGMNIFKSNLEQFLSRPTRPQGIVGINIGMNKAQSEPAKDYVSLIRMLAPMADYLAINISSPNTPGLRDLQKREPLLELLAAVMEERERSCGDHPPPILLKLAPDLDDAQCEELAGACVEGGVDGLILSNTTLDRPDRLPEKFRNETGGLSGAPVREKSTNIIRKFYKLTEGKIPIIGVGGVFSGAQAYEKIKAGASLIGLYTGLVYEGPAVANSVNRDLIKLLNADGYQNVSEAVGADHL